MCTPCPRTAGLMTSYLACAFCALDAFGILATTHPVQPIINSKGAPSRHLLQVSFRFPRCGSSAFAEFGLRAHSENAKFLSSKLSQPFMRKVTIALAVRCRGTLLLHSLPRRWP